MEYRRLSLRLKNAVQIESGQYPVFACAAVDAPFSIGILHKRVYVPDGLSETDLSMVVAHAHTHLSRHDPLWKLISYALRCIHWMNPLVHIACRLWGADMEYTCDERTFRWMSSDFKANYCEALLNISQSTRPIPCPVAFAEGGIRGRIRNLLRPRKHKAFWDILAVLIVLDAYCLGFTGAYGITGWARLPAENDFRQRLELTLDTLAADPEKANASGYFEFFHPPVGEETGIITSDDQTDWGMYFMSRPSGAYMLVSPLYAEEGVSKYRVLIKIYPDDLRFDEAVIDPRRDTGRYMHIQDYSWSSQIDWKYTWWYHYQTERAEIGIVVFIYENGDLFPNPIYPALNDMMDKVLSAAET